MPHPLDDGSLPLLGSWPTPCEPQPRLAAALGLGADDLWLKRDDLVGLGGGGNKVRKLEWSMAEALREAAEVVVTTGAAQSNHARLTAAAASALGVEAVLVLAGHAPEHEEGNLVLDRLFDATTIWAGDVDEHTLADRAVREVEALRDAGRRVALIPYGGSSPTSVNGYVTCAKEITVQIGTPDHVVCAVGSGGTMAGLVRGLGAERVLGVHTGAVDDPFRAVLDLMPGTELDREALRIDTDHVGPGYSHLGPGVLDACRMTARRAGVVLDPVYTGRAMAGLAAAVERGEVRPGQRTVFVHTGGLPGLFGHPEIVAALTAR